jgi:hypothetical protein
MAMECAKAAVHPSLAAFARLLSSPVEGSGGKETLPVGFRGRNWPALVDRAIGELGLEET